MQGIAKLQEIYTEQTEMTESDEQEHNEVVTKTD